MADVFKKLIMLTVIYGGISLIAGKGASGNLVRFSCALGMLVFLSSTLNEIISFESLDFGISDIEQSVQKGEEIFKTGLNKEISAYIERDIKEICRKYGANGDVEIGIKIETRQVKIETIELIGNFESIQGMGFIKNEIMDIYGVDEVKIIEK